MIARIQKLLRKFLGDESAPSAIEYALLVAGVGVLILAVVYMLGGGASTTFRQAAPTDPTASSSSSPE